MNNKHTGLEAKQAGHAQRMAETNGAGRRQRGEANPSSSVKGLADRVKVGL